MGQFVSGAGIGYSCLFCFVLLLSFPFFVFCVLRCWPLCKLLKGSCKLLKGSCKLFDPLRVIKQFAWPFKQFAWPPFFCDRGFARSASGVVWLNPRAKNHYKKQRRHWKASRAARNFQRLSCCPLSAVCVSLLALRFSFPRAQTRTAPAQARVRRYSCAVVCLRGPDSAHWDPLAGPSCQGPASGPLLTVRPSLACFFFWCFFFEKKCYKKKAFFFFRANDFALVYLKPRFILKKIIALCAISNFGNCAHYTLASFSQFRCAKKKALIFLFAPCFFFFGLPNFGSFSVGIWQGHEILETSVNLCKSL